MSVTLKSGRHFELAYSLWQNPLGIHHSHLVTTLKELSLLVESGQKSLQTTQTAIQIVQTQLNERREERDQTLQQWLAIIGIMLAVPQFISEKVATRLLTLLAVPKTGTEYDIFLILSLQLLVGVLIWALARLISHLVKR